MKRKYADEMELGSRCAKCGTELECWFYCPMCGKPISYAEEIRIEKMEILVDSNGEYGSLIVVTDSNTRTVNISFSDIDTSSLTSIAEIRGYEPLIKHLVKLDILYGLSKREFTGDMEVNVKGCVILRNLTNVFTIEI